MAKTFEIKGLKELIGKIDKLPKKIAEEIDDELADGALAMVQDAQRRVPVGLSGFLKGGITFHPLQPMQYEVVSSMHYSPYVEFGTGATVNVPAGLEDYASQFKGAGVKQVNLPARPFFFPALEKVKPEIIKKIKEILAKQK